MGTGRNILASIEQRRQRKRDKSTVELLSKLGLAGGRDEIGILSSRIPDVTNDPDRALQLLDFAKTQSSGLGNEQFLREATSLALPSQISGQVDTGLPPTQAELGQDILAFAADQGVTPGVARGALTELSPFARDAGAATKVEQPYKLGSTQQFIGQDGVKKEGVFAGLDAQGNPKWQKVVDVPVPAPAGRAPVGELKLENVLDDIGATTSRIAGITARENILTEALGDEGIKDALAILEKQLDSRYVSLFKNFPEEVEIRGLQQPFTAWQFKNDSDMKDNTLGTWSEDQGFEILDQGGKVVGHYVGEYN